MSKKQPNNDVKKKMVSKSQKAGLTFPISRLNHVLKRKSGMKRVGASAPVFLTAVAEYVVAEIINIAGAHTKAAKPVRKRITPEDVSLAIRGDEDLSKLCASVVVYSGDKINNIADALKPNKRSASDRKHTTTT
jgi:histone H2A|eukprot:3900785-Prymnesium_polylepis.2